MLVIAVDPAETVEMMRIAGGLRKTPGITPMLNGTNMGLHRMDCLSRCGWVLVFAMQALCSFSSESVAQDSKPNEIKSISRQMEQFISEKQLSGAVTLIVHKGEVVHLSAVGEADIETHRAMQPDSLFAIASMTKPITATALMILQDENKLQVTDPVSKYVPEFRDVMLDNGAPGRALTIRDLLTHTSGMGGSQATEGTLKETAEMLAKRPLSFEPGKKWQYSPGITVCGRIVEVVSGKPFDVFLAERIFQPLKMTDTTFQPTEAQLGRLARNYGPSDDGKAIVPVPHGLQEFPENRTPNPSGGLVSSAVDLARFYQMILNGGELDGKRIISRSAIDQMTRIQTGELVTGFTPGNGWGLGWCVVREPQGVTKMLSPGSYGHGGALGTQGWVDPRKGTIFVLMIQRTGFGSGDGSRVREVFQQLAVDALTK